MATHTFEGDSGDAYNQTQYRDDIHSGDILVVPSEQVIGVMVSAWPTAVTVAHGKFHAVTPDKTWDEVALIWAAEDVQKEWLKEKPDYAEALIQARLLADVYGWVRR